MLQLPSAHIIDPVNGRLGGNSRHYTKALRDLEGLYRDEAAFAALVASDGDRIVYEVQDHHPKQAVGDLIFGITRMEPGRVGEEYYLTRGHIHAKANRPEVYIGECGSGLMVMESPEGEVRILEVLPRVICYVPPYWIHRSVNVGREPLVMSFVYPSDSGQDYGIIAATGGMRSRIIADGDGWREVPNSAYRPRNAEEIRKLYEMGAT